MKKSGLFKNRHAARSPLTNTPAQTRCWGTRARNDGYYIRNAALRSGISIITTVAAAAAAVEAIESMQKEDWKIKSLQDYYKQLDIKVQTKTFGKVKGAPVKGKA